MEIANEYHLDDWLSANLDAAVTRGRFDHDWAPDDLGCGDAAPAHSCPQPIAIVGRYIPNSPTSVIETGVQVHPASGWFGAIQARHFGESPLVEDNSARSPAYTTVDIQIGYHSPRRWRAALDIFNVANLKWNDIEYYYVSRLRNEPWPAAGYVVHPGVPRTLRIRLEYSF